MSDRTKWQGWATEWDITKRWARRQPPWAWGFAALMVGGLVGFCVLAKQESNAVMLQQAYDICQQNMVHTGHLMMCTDADQKCNHAYRADQLKACSAVEKKWRAAGMPERMAEQQRAIEKARRELVDRFGSE